MDRLKMLIFSLFICASYHNGLVSSTTVDCSAPTPSSSQPVVDTVRLTTTVGFQTVLPCHTSLPNDVDWTFQQTHSSTDAKCILRDGYLVNGYSSVFAIDKPTPGDYNLIILNALLNYTGLYTCVENGGLGPIHRVYLTVTDIPIITANSGSEAYLPCRSALLNRPANWISESSTNSDKLLRVCTNGRIETKFSTRFKLDTRTAGDNNLVILNVQPTDSGEYTCIENEGRGIQHRMRLIVLDTQRSIASTAGSVVVFGCEVFTVLRTTWSFKHYNSTNTELLYDGNSITKASQDNMEVLTVSDRYRNLNVLSIRHVQSSHSGKYTCSPGDDVTSQQSYELVVLENELWCNISALNYSVRSSDNFVIQCHIKYTGNLHPTIVCSHGLSTVVLKQHNSLFTDSIPLSNVVGKLSCQCKAVFNASYNPSMLPDALTWNTPNVLDGRSEIFVLITSTADAASVMNKEYISTSTTIGIILGTLLVVVIAMIAALLCRTKRRCVSEFTTVPHEEKDTELPEENNYETSFSNHDGDKGKVNGSQPSRPRRLLPSTPDQTSEYEQSTVSS